VAARRPDYRSAEAAEYRKLYKTSRWKARRAAQLAEHPLCERCLVLGVAVAATVANHRTPHRGDLVLFWEGPLESTCKPHHDGAIQREELAGFSAEVDAAGWPTDPRHRALRRAPR
jgi:5-methylcytosine-specific restriction enzyme A